MNGFLVENGGMQSSIQDAGRKGFSDIGLTKVERWMSWRLGMPIF